MGADCELVDDVLIEALGRNRLGEEFGDAGIARRDHALLLRMSGEHDDRHVRVGVGAGLADHLGKFEASKIGIAQLVITLSGCDG